MVDEMMADESVDGHVRPIGDFAIAIAADNILQLFLGPRKGVPAVAYHALAGQIGRVIHDACKVDILCHALEQAHKGGCSQEILDGLETGRLLAIEKRDGYKPEKSTLVAKCELVRQRS
jgi:hypothetical protein